MNLEVIKKIIIREGLVIVGVIAASILLICYSSIYLCIHNFIGKVFSQSETIWLVWADKPLYVSILKKSGWYLLFFGYPVYLLIRFWAIKTLKKK